MRGRTFSASLEFDAIASLCSAAAEHVSAEHVPAEHFFVSLVSVVSCLSSHVPAAAEILSTWAAAAAGRWLHLHQRGRDLDGGECSIVHAANIDCPLT